MDFETGVFETGKVAATIVILNDSEGSSAPKKHAFMGCRRRFFTAF